MEVCDCIRFNGHLISSTLLHELVERSPIVKIALRDTVSGTDIEKGTPSEMYSKWWLCFQGGQEINVYVKNT